MGFGFALNKYSTVDGGLDDPDRLSRSLGSLLVGQVDFIHKLNYLNVTWISKAHMFFRKRH